MIIKKTTKHEYYEKIIAMQYNINIHVPKMNQVQMIRNNIDAKYNNEIMKWPKTVAPFDIVIIPSISKNNKENLEKAEKVYDELKKQNIDVLLDDVDENMSNKFKKHDLIGVPYQIIIGSKSDGDNFEFKELNSKTEILSLDKIKLKLIN